MYPIVKIRSFLLTNLMLIVSTSLSAQNRCEYKYDANGNIVSRVKVSLSVEEYKGIDRNKLSNEINSDIRIIKEASNKFRVESLGSTAEKEVRVYNSAAQIVEAETFDEQNKIIDLSGKQNGVYIIEVETPEGKKSLKTLIQ